ncbi:hypothetical protein ACFLZK_00350 [Patescibacteria group bacterium]
MRKLKKIGLKSFVKFNVFYAGFMGLIFGLIGGIPMLLFGGANTFFGDADVGMGMGSGFGIATIIGAPLVYGLMGLVGGFIGGLLLNFILKLSGGIDVEVVDVAPVVEATLVAEEKA